MVGVCAGSPDYPSWKPATDDMAAMVEDACPHCQFPSGAESHRRGEFLALAKGALFGGGQKVSRSPV